MLKVRVGMSIARMIVECEIVSMLVWSQTSSDVLIFVRTLIILQCCFVSYDCLKYNKKLLLLSANVFAYR